MTTVNGKTAFITGAGTGLGLGEVDRVGGEVERRNLVLPAKLEGAR